MIKSRALLKHHSLQNGPGRYRILDDETKSYVIVYEKNKEFEELMLTFFLLDKYYPSENKFSFGTDQEEYLKEVKEDIEQLYTFLTNRKISLKIVPINRRLVQQQRMIVSESWKPKRGAPCLFSGGLDSTAGALILTKNDLAPTLSHTVTGNIVYGKVCKLKRHPTLRDLPLIITDMRTAAADSSPVMTRGLLFLSNALVLASSMGHKEVYMPENGPLMINPRVSSLAEPTKNAHPYLLTTLERVYNHLTQSKMKINPIFKDETKADLIARIHNANTLIDRTWSCFKIQGQAKMCGLCYACLVRRLSALAAGYQEPTGTYEFDAFLVKREELGQSLRTDLDILYDTFVYLEKLLKDDSLIRNETLMIPSGFFEDVIKLMRNFSIDMFLGMHKYLQNAKEDNLGPLGRFSKKVLKKVPESELKVREDEIKSLLLGVRSNS